MKLTINEYLENDGVDIYPATVDGEEVGAIWQTHGVFWLAWQWRTQGVLTVFGSRCFTKGGATRALRRELGL